MPAWPGTLPTGPLLEGLEYEPGETAIHSENDEGPHKSRRRFTKPINQMKWPMLLTLTQWQALYTFFYEDCEGGAITVTGLTDPFTGNAMTVKILKPPKPVPDNQFIRTTLDFMIMP